MKSSTLSSTVCAFVILSVLVLVLDREAESGHAGKYPYARVVSAGPTSAFETRENTLYMTSHTSVFTSPMPILLPGMPKCCCVSDGIPLPVDTDVATSTVTAIPIPPELAALPDIDKVPIYPGAKMNRVVGTISSGEINFETADDIEEVYAYYRSAMPARGWTLFGSGVSLDYDWSDPDHMLLWNLAANVSTFRLTDEGGTEVKIRYSRLPEVSRIPTTPGAEHNEKVVEERTVESQNGPRSEITTTITYSTYESPKELEDFYNATLPPHGWSYYTPYIRPSHTPEPRSIKSKLGLQFSSWRRGHPGPRNPTDFTITLSVTVQHKPDGKMQVQLKIKESEIGYF